MRKNKILRLIWLAVAVVLAISTMSGCNAENTTDDDKAQNGIGDSETNKNNDAVITENDGKFTLRYYADDSLNPFTCENVYNDAVTSLIYEGLFRLDDEFRPEKVLCADYSTEDGCTYVFTINEVKLHDGTNLTVGDVAYSINEARLSSKYSARLANISYCGENEDGSLTVELNKADYSLPSLLDVPIVKYGTGDNDHPIGTGPYYYNRAGGDDRLALFKEYRTAGDITLEHIYLAEFTDTSVEESFANYALECIWEDTADETPVNLYSSHEARYYNTSILQYIGFNNTSVMKDKNIRMAVSYAVNRQQIVDELYNGNGSAAEMVLHPKYYLYSDTWEEEYKYSVAKVSACLAESKLDDKNGDGYLEYPKNDIYEEFEINFVVYSGNDRKVKAAESIAETLRNVGLNIKLTALSWEEYKSALNNRNFDMYYGETALTRNFDFSLFVDANGALNYGNMESEECKVLCSNFLTAAGEEEKTLAAEELCKGFAENAIIVPIMYRQYVTYTHRGMISNFYPSVSGVFSDAARWKVELN